MEGLNVRLNQPAVTGMEEAASLETRKGKVDKAEISVKSMFNEKMESTGVIRRLQESPYFQSFESRSPNL
jgi:hypothetical protein